jgi:hypothetical protein
MKWRKSLLFLSGILTGTVVLFARNTQAGPGEALISEVMANPVGLTVFPETEYVEIYNASTDSLSLDGWSFVYDGKASLLPDTLLPPGAYAVLFREGRAIFVADSGIIVPVSAFPSALANTG